jgi:acetyl-CoA C-acetyltransferase
MMRDAVLGALATSGVAADEVDVAHIGNFAGELFTGQGHLGGLFASITPAFDGVPAARHEAACASGSMAVLAAGADLEAGRYDVAVVVGVEQMRNVATQEAAEHLGAALWVGAEATDEAFPWPAQFSEIVEEYDARHGVEYQHLMALAEKAFDNAKRNHNAQTRSWRFEDDAFGADDELNPVVAGRIRKQDCARITDGAVAVVLASDRFATRWAARRNADLTTIPRVTGWGHRTARMKLADKLAAGRETPFVFPHVRAAITDAWGRAGIAGPEALDLIETHDCFTITEYMAIDHFGLTPPGRSWEAIEDGMITLDGRLPVNPSGGLIGAGHPVGATGVRMVLDAHRQLTGAAGDYQVDGARRVQTLNIGGSATTVASFVVER